LITLTGRKKTFAPIKTNRPQVITFILLPTVVTTPYTNVRACAGLLSLSVFYKCLNGAF